MNNDWGSFQSQRSSRGGRGRGNSYSNAWGQTHHNLQNSGRGQVNRTFQQNARTRGGQNGKRNKHTQDNANNINNNAQLRHEIDPSVTARKFKEACEQIEASTKKYLETQQFLDESFDSSSEDELDGDAVIGN